MKLKLFKSILTQTVSAVAICGAIFALPAASRAQDIVTVSNSTSSAFMANGPSGNLSTTNYGNAGTLAIAPAGSSKGAFDSVLLFNTSTAVSQFNTMYGIGGWTITGVTLSLASQYGTNGAAPMNGIFNPVKGGSFGIYSLTDTTWTPGTGGGTGTAGYPNPNGYIDYAYIPTLLSFGYDSLGDFTYTPPGNNVYETYLLPTDVNLDSAAADGIVSLYFYAADNQVSYLFNSQQFSSNHPQLTLTATPTPEPATLSLLAAAGALFIARRQARKS
jgi:hypothetical protein